MLSRIADALFWMNRYIERSEGILRTIKTNYTTSLEKYEGIDYSWAPVLKTFTDLSEDKIQSLSGDTHQVLQYMLVDMENFNSIRNNIYQARENARIVQDYITKELWEAINEYYLLVKSDAIEKSLSYGEANQIVVKLIQQSIYFYGVAEVTMPRGLGWNIMNIGKFIERTIQTSNLLQMKKIDINQDHINILDMPYWKNLLLSLSGYEFYMKINNKGLIPKDVINMLVFNENFPRSIFYCNTKIHHITEKIARDKNETNKNLLRQSSRIAGDIKYSDIDTLSLKGLHDFLDETIYEIYEFSNTISKAYFAYY